MFTSITDNSLERWHTDKGTYAVTSDQDAVCPAGDLDTGRNCAWRAGGDRFGDVSILDGEHVTYEVSYNGYTFTAAAATADEAEMVAHAFSHWAEGDVYLVGFSNNDGEEFYIGGVYTEDGVYPGLSDIQEMF